MIKRESPRLLPGLVAIAVLPLALACSGKQVGGQTGSPEDAPPDYTSPTRFTPGDGEGTSTDGSGTGLIDFLNRNFPSEPAELIQLDGDSLVLFVPPEEYTGPNSDPRQQGLKIYDLGEPTAPTELGEVAIPGWPIHLHLDADAVTLAIVQPNTDEFEGVPSEAVPTQVTRLLRVDLSDPSTPELVASMDIDGEYVRSVQLGDRTVVVSQFVEPRPVECVVDGSSFAVTGDIYQPSELPDGDTQIVSYRFEAGAFQVLDTLSLSGLFQVASTSQDGFVLQHAESLDGESVFEEVLLVDASDAEGSLAAGEPLSLVGGLSAATWHDGVLSTAQTINAVAEYRVYDASDITALTSLGIAPLRVQGSRILAGADNLVLIDPSTDTGIEGQATLIDISDPTSPSAVELAGATAAEFTPSGAVGVARTETGHVALRLWDLTEPAAPALLEEAETDWAFTYSTGAYGHLWHFYDEADLLVHPFGVYETETIDNRVGIARVSDAGFDVLAALPTSDLPRNVAVTSETLYSASPGGLDIVPTDGSDNMTLPLYPERAGRVVFEREAGDWQARIVSTSTQTLVELRRSSQDDPVVFDLGHFAEELTVVGDRLVALGLSRYSDCDYEEVASVELLGMCPVPNVNGISVFSLGDAPALEWEQTLPTEYGSPSDLPADARWSVSWYGYLETGADSLLLPATQRIRCESQAACDQLSIEASEGAASSGSGSCSSEGECSTAPAVTITHSGSEATHWFYRLNVGGSPSLEPELEVANDFEWRYGLEDSPLNLEGEVLRDGPYLGFWHYDYDYDYDAADGEPATDQYGEPLVKHFVDRYLFDDDGVLQFDASINVPGIPLSFAADGESLITLEPLYATNTIDAQVHRSVLRDGGAYIEETLTLGPGFRDHNVVGNQAYLIFGPAERCAEDPTSRIFTIALTDDELSAAPALELEGENWDFVWWEQPWGEDTILLRGGPAETSGRLELDVSDAATAPEVVRYFVAER